MRKPHHPVATLLVSSLVCFSFLFGTQVNSLRAQQVDASATSPTTAHGIQFYESGDAANAIKVLEEVVKKHADDVDAWYYLGLTYHRLGWTAEARPPFEHVIALRPNSADATAKLSYALIVANEPSAATSLAQRAIELGDKGPEPHYVLAEASLRTAQTFKADESALRTKALEVAIEQATQALNLDPGFGFALITKSFAQYKLQQYAAAAASLEQFVALKPNDPDADTWREQLREMSNRAANLKSATTDAAETTTTFSPRELEQTAKARVLTKPEPQYTEAARKAGVTGTIILRGIFASNGKVTNLSVAQALPFGLTTATLNAARKITFIPATKNGRAVSMYIQLEYNFSLY